MNFLLKHRQPKLCGSSLDFEFIDGFHGDVIRLQSQKSQVLRILIYTRLKIYRK